MNFMRGGGTTGSLMRSQDWARTEIGDPAAWPPSLQTLVDLILSTSQPMFIAWGPRQFTLANDAFVALTGAQTPPPGTPLAEAWPRLSDSLSPLLDRVRRAKPLRSHDVAIVTGSESRTVQISVAPTPVHAADGSVAGVLCVCHALTDGRPGQRPRSRKTARLHDLFERSRSYLAVLRGPRHRHEMANTNYRRLVGDRDIVGLTVKEALPELAAQGVHDHLDQVLRTGEPLINGVQFRVSEAAAAAQDLWLDFVYQPIREANGSISGVFVEGFDVTCSRGIHDALRQSEQRLRFTVESATDYAILTTDTDGLITSWSRGAEAAFRWPRDEVLGQPYATLFVPSDREAMRPTQELADAAREGLASDERWHQRKDGSLVFMNGSVRPLNDASGQQLGFIKVARDETERRRQDEALRKSLAHQAALVELGDRLRDLDDIREMAVAAAEIAGRTLGVTRAGHGLVDPRRETIMVERDGWAIPDTDTLSGVWQFADFGGYVTDLRRGETVAVGDTAGSSHGIGQLDPFVAIGSRAFINVPIVQHGQFLALFYLHQTTPRDWSSDEVAFARAVADRVWAATERLHAEQRLRTLNATLEAQIEERTRERDRIWNISRDLMAVVGSDGMLHAANPAWERVLGYRPDELIGRPINAFIHPDDQPAASTAGEVPPAFENRYRHKMGSYRWLSWTAAMAVTADNSMIYVNGRDITDEKAAKEALLATEDALRQSQKMEAVGQLTGGIAHDFNNILTGIMGSLDILRQRIEAGRIDEIARFMDAAQASAQRAASLTHRLLAFARRQSLDPKPSDVNRLVGGMEELLRRTLGEQIGLRTVLASDLWPAITDAHQLEGALLNLAINARDAMPDGGLLTIETRNTLLDSAFVSLHGASAADDLKAGDYVAISVSDTGVGMSPDVKARAFDPFFTTKPIGQGTGLGLSMVYGFAKQSKGHVRIHSESGLGCTVRLYLPRAHGVSDSVPVQAAVAAPRGGGETVLVVEDDETVRLLITDVLKELGYAYLEAGSGAAAITVIRSSRRIDLMISDVGLPGMNGRQLAEVARQMRPGLKVLLVTGYAEITATRGGLTAAGIQMMTKPFALEDLANTVRAMLPS